jgi:hypothetical protein
MLASLSFAGYVISRVFHASHPGWIAVWFVGAIVAHDMVLFPLYAAVDALVMRHRPGRRTSVAGVPWRNHVRVPVVLSGILLLMTFPLVFRLSEHAYFAATGLHTSVYLGRWLAVTGCIFASSGVVFVARMIVHRGRQPSLAKTTDG